MLDDTSDRVEELEGTYGVVEELVDGLPELDGLCTYVVVDVELVLDV